MLRFAGIISSVSRALRAPEVAVAAAVGVVRVQVFSALMRKRVDRRVCLMIDWTRVWRCELQVRCSAGNID